MFIVSSSSDVKILGIEAASAARLPCGCNSQRTEVPAPMNCAKLSPFVNKKSSLSVCNITDKHYVVHIRVVEVGSGYARIIRNKPTIATPPLANGA